MAYNVNACYLVPKIWLQSPRPIISPTDFTEAKRKMPVELARGL